MTRTYARQPDVLWRRTLNGVLVLRPQEPEIVELAGASVAVWAALEFPCTRSELADDLAHALDADHVIVSRELGLVLDELVTRSLVRVSE